MTAPLQQPEEREPHLHYASGRGSCSVCGVPMDETPVRLWSLSQGFMVARFADTRAVVFTVYGKPVPQGSTRAFIPKGWKRAVITTDNKNLKPWRQQISETAASLGLQRIDGDTPVAIGLDFYFERPKSAPKRRKGMTVKPDIDKLIRGILDSLTGILFEDDAQVTRFDYVGKHYGMPERVEILVRENL